MRLPFGVGDALAAATGRPSTFARVFAAFVGATLFGFAVPPESPQDSGSAPVHGGLVIAHRGASYDAPEETEPAYLLARELGAAYLELDLQRTADGVLIAFHDDDLRRTTDVEAIFPEEDLPEEWQKYIEINAEWYQNK